MTKSELNDPYFEWMYRLVVDDRYSNKSYRRLFYKLHDTEFAYTIPMDGNRAEDGIELRYRFGREQGYRDAVIANRLDIRPCSILEMMIALAIRCEEHIMEDPDIGNRTGQWFWSMLVSLGLGSMSDVRFDPVRSTRFSTVLWIMTTHLMVRAVCSQSVTLGLICGLWKSGIR